MDVKEARTIFEKEFKHIDSAILTFKGVEGFDVYNCSQPFHWEGSNYLFGRIENRTEWMRSWVQLFKQTNVDEWTLVPDSMIYQLEDPYISFVGDQLVMGGTHVRIQQERLDTYYGYFYKGTELNNLYYFTTGPEYMKDIRVVQLENDKIGVFSRPRNPEIYDKYGSESMIGFTIINSLDELSAEVISNAPYLDGLFKDGEWGGCNQAYLLEDGKVGVLGHVCYQEDKTGQSIYTNMTFVINPLTKEISDYKLVGTRKSYPDGPAKKIHLKDCAFTSLNNS